MKRVLVIGPGGAGKSTMSVRIGEKTGLSVVHLDRYFWRSGWNRVTAEEWDAIVDDLVRKPEWVMDGNYGGTLDRRLPVADTVVFLDTHPLLCAWRVTARWARFRGRSRPSMAEGCPDRLTFEFLWWILTYRWRRRPSILRKLNGLGGGQTVKVLRTVKDQEEFLSAL